MQLAGPGSRARVEELNQWLSRALEFYYNDAGEPSYSLAKVPPLSPIHSHTNAFDEGLKLLGMNHSQHSKNGWADDCPVELQPTRMTSSSQRVCPTEPKETNWFYVLAYISKVLRLPCGAGTQGTDQFPRQRDPVSPDFYTQFVLPSWIEDQNEPPTDAGELITSDEALVIFGRNLAHYIWEARGFHRDDLRTANLQIDSCKENVHTTLQVEFCYPHTPVFFPSPDWGLFNTDKVQHALQTFAGQWPQTLARADFSQCTHYTPGIQQFKWLQRGRKIEQCEVTSTIIVPGTFPSVSKHPISTRAVVDTGTDPIGSICFLNLHKHADVFSLRDAAQSAAHLFEEVVTRADVRREANFLHLEQFLCPVIGEMNARDDNISWGPWNDSESLVAGIQYHLKCLSAIDGPKRVRMAGTYSNCTVDGLRLKRKVHAIGPKQDVWVGERRISIAILASFGKASGSSQEATCKRYNALCIVSPGCEFKLPDPKVAMVEKQIAPYGDHWAPVCCFLTLFACGIRVWYESWDSFLDALDVFEDENNLLQHRLCNGSLHGGARDEKTCLEIAKLLRTATRWVNDTQRDLGRLRYEIMDQQPTMLPGSRLMNRNWDEVEALLKERSERLTAKINRLIEEIEGLRRDLRNTASREEASRGIHINRIVLLFTSITVIYLPLNLIASICGNSVSINFGDSQHVTLVACGSVFVVAATYLLASRLYFWFKPKSMDGYHESSGGDNRSTWSWSRLLQARQNTGSESSRVADHSWSTSSEIKGEKWWKRAFPVRRLSERSAANESASAV